jgi:hypothetical protein
MTSSSSTACVHPSRSRGGTSRPRSAVGDLRRVGDLPLARGSRGTAGPEGFAAAVFDHGGRADHPAVCLVIGASLAAGIPRDGAIVKVVALRTVVGLALGLVFAFLVVPALGFDEWYARGRDRAVPPPRTVRDPPSTTGATRVRLQRCSRSRARLDRAHQRASRWWGWHDVPQPAAARRRVLPGPPRAHRRRHDGAAHALRRRHPGVAVPAPRGDPQPPALAPLALRLWRTLLSAGLVVGAALLHLLVGPEISFGFIAVPVTVYTLAARAPPWGVARGPGVAVAGALANGVKVAYMGAAALGQASPNIAVGVIMAAVSAGVVVAAWAFGDVVRSRALARGRSRTAPANSRSRRPGAGARRRGTSGTASPARCTTSSPTPPGGHHPGRRRPVRRGREPGRRRRRAGDHRGHRPRHWPRCAGCGGAARARRRRVPPPTGIDGPPRPPRHHAPDRPRRRRGGHRHARRPAAAGAELRRYRVAQEALTNAARHGGRTSAPRGAHVVPVRPGDRGARRRPRRRRLARHSRLRPGPAGPTGAR